MANFSEFSEDSLVDDEMEGNVVRGTLTFNNDVDQVKGPSSLHPDGNLSNVVLPDLHNVVTVGKPGPAGITFDVIDARIEDDQGDRFVLYTILLLRSCRTDSMPVKIEKRFTDLSCLNTTLRKRFSQLMRDISFPSKRISGNFRAETIANRSRSFEQYLSHLFSIEMIRTSSEFTDFFYGPRLREGYRLIQNGIYTDALPFLILSWKLQTKILGNCNVETVSTLCAVVACYTSLEQDSQAEMYAELALESIANDDRNPHLIPLLKLHIRLCWKMGKDKKKLELRLETLKQKGHEVDGSLSLLEQVVNRFKS